VLDSAILIRTAEISAAGRLRIPVGATLVRHSSPPGEAQETRAKAASLVSALATDRRHQFGDHPAVCAALRSRNDGIADFWLAGDGRRGGRRPGLALPLAGRTGLVVDAEDDFTSMLGQQLRSLGLTVDLRRAVDGPVLAGYDLIVMGPGPGDPRDLGDPRVARLHEVIAELLAARRPFIAVCLSHQVLSTRLGLELRRRAVPNQGVQHEIELFGRREHVGFYNSYVACSAEATFQAEGVGSVEASRDPHTQEVHALRGPHFASMQFHAESVLTVDGPRILAEAARGALGQ
jgi:2-amino-4-deoxychorismate synthase